MLSRKSHTKQSKNKHKQTEEEEVEQRPQAPIIEVWENTYRLEPQKLFKSYLAQKELDSVFEQYLNDDLKYDDAESIKRLSNTLSSEIKQRITKLDIPRYKVVVQTFIGQLKGQSVTIGSRWLWNANTDNYVSKHWKNNNIYVTSLVFATYLE